MRAEPFGDDAGDFRVVQDDVVVDTGSRERFREVSRDIVADGTEERAASIFTVTGGGEIGIDVAQGSGVRGDVTDFRAFSENAKMHDPTPGLDVFYPQTA